MFLSAADLFRLTKRVKPSAQRRALDRLGIRYTLAADGEPLVRVDWLDGGSPPGRNSGPRWDLLNA